MENFNDVFGSYENKNNNSSDIINQIVRKEIKQVIKKQIKKALKVKGKKQLTKKQVKKLMKKLLSDQALSIKKETNYEKSSVF